MKKLLSAAQTRAVDVHTIAALDIPSHQLMERAALAFCDAFVKRYSGRDLRIAVLCGPGNNGGDGLAIARILSMRSYQHCTVYIPHGSASGSLDFEYNLERLCLTNVRRCGMPDAGALESADVIIDALFGSGINRALEGLWVTLVNRVNALGKPVVAVDVPSGMPCDGIDDTTIPVLKASWVISFQRPKLSFLLPESEHFMEEFSVVDIGLDEDFMQASDSAYMLLEGADIAGLLNKRKNFAHKGSFGHALVVAGAPQTMGAALLASRACLHSGAGLTTALIPDGGLHALNVSTPEAMAITRHYDVDDLKVDWSVYNALCIGPGLGRSAKRLVELVLNKYRSPIVADADALNIIAENYELMQLLPEFSVLTPHVKEFDRLFGKHLSWRERLITGIDRARTLGCTIVLKNRYTMIFTPDGRCLFNPTGSPSMATGGMGDVLTGMITAFIAQRYQPVVATMLAVYIHGQAGTLSDDYVVTPSRLIESLPAVIAGLLRSTTSTL